MLVLAAVAAFAYVLDLISKIVVVAHLEYEPPIDVLGDWLQLRATRNAGAAFGIGEALTIVFTVIATVVIIVIVRLARQLRSWPWAVALGMLLGGALGNLTDRIFRSPGVFRGHVVDFIAPKHFAVFNLADSAIVVGGCLIVLLSFIGLHPDGTREDAEGDRDERGGDPGSGPETGTGTGTDQDRSGGARRDDDGDGRGDRRGDHDEDDAGAEDRDDGEERAGER